MSVLWAPSRQAVIISFQDCTAVCYGATGTCGQQNFNAKWAKRQGFLPLRWIDFLLWSVQGSVINVYLFLMGVYRTVHVLWALWMCMPVTVRLFMWVMWVHITAIAPISECVQSTLIHEVLFDRSHWQAVGSIAGHYAYKSHRVRQWPTFGVFALFKMHIHTNKQTKTIQSCLSLRVQ